MQILVVGGAGYIGSHAVRALTAAGHKVVVLDNLSTGHAGAVKDVQFVRGDIGDAGVIDDIFVTHRIEGVMHFAALCYVGDSVRDPAAYYRNNVVYGLQLLEACRKHGVARFVFSSTAATYGDPSSSPITEDMPQRPINPYGNTKLAFEWALTDYAAAYDFGFAALRYFNAAGASADGTIGEDHDPESHLIPLVLQVALGQRKHIEIFGTDYPTPDGTCIRDYIHVEDLASAHVLALEKIQPGTGLKFNVGIGKGYSVRELIRVAQEVTGADVPVVEGPRRAGDPAELVASSDRIRTELNWQPKFPELRQIVSTAWNWHKNHPRGYADRN